MTFAPKPGNELTTEEKFWRQIKAEQVVTGGKINGGNIVRNFLTEVVLVFALTLHAVIFQGGCREVANPPTAQQVEQLVLQGKSEQAIELLLAQRDLTKPDVLPGVIALSETIIRRCPWAYLVGERMSRESLRKFLESPPDLRPSESTDVPRDSCWESVAALVTTRLDAQTREFLHLAYLSDPPEFAAMREKMLDKTLLGRLRLRYATRLAALGDLAGWSFIEDIWAEREVLKDWKPFVAKRGTLYEAELYFPRGAQERLLGIVHRHWKGRYDLNEYGVGDMLEDEDQMRAALFIAIRARPKIDVFLKQVANRKIPEAVVAKAALGDARAIAAARRLAKATSRQLGEGSAYDTWVRLAILASAGIPQYEGYASDALVSSEGPFEYLVGDIIECGTMLPEPRRFQFLSRTLIDETKDNTWHETSAIVGLTATQGRAAYRPLLKVMKRSLSARWEAAKAIVEIEFRLRLEEIHKGKRQ
ncbi:MAG: hypothetical protein QGD94_10345 [Planctomycetia bacterium]|nr:hypothetical protein [Planctomycetia bacterium]